MADTGYYGSVGDGIVGGLLGGLPIAGGIYAGLKNANAVKAKKGDVAEWDRDLQSWYDLNSNQNYLDTSAGKAVITKASENLLNANKVAENAGAVTGATNEASLAAKTVNQRNFSDTLAQITAQGTGRQDQVDARYMYQNNNIMREKLGLHDADIQSAQNQAANNAALTSDYASILGLII